MRRFLLLLCVAMAPLPAFAQTPSAQEITVLRQQINALSERLAELERQAADERSAGPAPVATPPAIEAEPTSVDGRHFRTAGPIRITPATLDRPVQPPGGGIEISAASGSADVSFSVTSGGSNPNLRGLEGGWATSRNWTFTAKAPLDKGGDQTDLLTFDALTSGLELSFRWSNYRRWIADPRREPRALAIAADAREKCRATAPAEAMAQCATVGMSGTFIATHLGADKEREWLGTLFGRADGWGLEGSIGYNEHAFIDPILLGRDEETHVPWGVKAYYAFLPTVGSTSWTFAAEYQDAVEDADTGVLCPVSAVAPVTCLSGAIGAPTAVERLITSAEWRSQIELDNHPLFERIAVSAQFAFDHENDEYGVDLPVYLVPNGDGQLIGGVRLGYTSKDDAWVAGVFIGAPFSLR